MALSPAGEIEAGQSTPPLAVLEAVGLSRSFGPIEVLTDINLSIALGEIHAIIGENGAGKSTLMKILSGHLAPSRGALRLDGAETSLHGPVDAERRGIVLVHQEIMLAPHLSVAQNMFLGREAWRGVTLDDKAMNRRAVEAMRAFGVEVSPTVPVERLSIAQRQLAQIARALLAPHRIVIFDEPTASLTPIETEALHRLVRGLKAKGVAVIYISHRLNEVKEIADVVTVLRDGKWVATRPAEELEPVDMARLMVGRDLLALYPERSPPPGGSPIFEVEHFNAPGFAEDASFSVRRGEILGFAGLVGAGRTELFEALQGLRPGGGEIRVRGAPMRWPNARAAMDAGFAYLTEDRKGKGLLLRETLATNLTLAALERFQRGPLVDRAREAEALDASIERFDIRVGDPSLLAGQLSGGNQQKLLLAKMMQIDPQIVVIDEPTRGVDIGAKQQIYRFIAALAAEGRSVIVISSEMAELIGVCHRIVVMRAGRIVGEVSGEAMNEHDIVVLATGVEDHAMNKAVLGEEKVKVSLRRAARRVDLGAVAPFAALALLAVFGAFVNPRFVGFENLANVITRSAFIATIAVGQTLVITAGGLDLSVGAMAAFVSGVTILFLNSGMVDNPILMIGLAMLLALGLGATCGLANGLTTTLGKIEPFIVTLGTMGIFRSLVTWLAQGGSITIKSPDLRAAYRPIYFGDVFGVPIPVLAILGVALVGSFLLYRTAYGRHVMAVGSNEDVARFSGINVTRVRTLTYVFQGLCVAVAVIVYVPRLGSTTSTTGLLWELQAITAVIIGGTRLQGGVGRVWGTIAGALILEVIGNIMVLSDLVSEYLIGAVQGAIIIVAMLAQRSLRGR